MITRRTDVPPRSDATRRGRPARRLELFASPTAARTAAATDDLEQAEQLIADLSALVDAGLVAPVSDPVAQARYAIAEGGRSNA